MRISELIEELTMFMYQHGDVHVELDNGDFDMQIDSIVTVEDVTTGEVTCVICAEE